MNLINELKTHFSVPPNIQQLIGLSFAISLSPSLSRYSTPSQNFARLSLTLFVYRRQILINSQLLGIKLIFRYSMIFSSFTFTNCSALCCIIWSLHWLLINLSFVVDIYLCRLTWNLILDFKHYFLDKLFWKKEDEEKLPENPQG